MGDCDDDYRDAALASYEQVLGLYRAVGAKLGEANVLAAQSRLMIEGDLVRSQALLERALTMRRAIGDAYSEGADLGNYGIALLGRERTAEAVEYLRRARELFASRNIEQFVQYMDELIANAEGPAEPPG